MSPSTHSCCTHFFIASSDISDNSIPNAIFDDDILLEEEVDSIFDDEDDTRLDEDERDAVDDENNDDTFNDAI